MSVWTSQQVNTAKAVLKRYTIAEYQEALQEIGKKTGREVTGSSLRSVFLRLELGPPSSFCKQGTEAPAEAETIKPATHDVQRLVDLTKKSPISFAALCDKLDLAPRRVRALIEQAGKQHIEIHVEHDHVGIKTVFEEKIRDVGVAPVVGEEQKIGVISDTHLGSKYCLREQLRDFVLYAYSQGVREILHPGDILDGMYHHGMFEVSHVGLDDQAQDLFDVLPQLPGLSYRMITGNHDHTFQGHSGINVGQHLVRYFAERGRKDIHFYGNRSAFLRIKGVTIHMWHPKKGSGYAKSYSLQKRIEQYSSGEKPNVLLVGHWHIFCQVEERGVHGIACPTFQGGGSDFSKSLGSAPAIGGLILSWTTTEHGTMRDFSLRKRSYFEVEQPHSIEELEPREIKKTRRPVGPLPRSGRA